MRVLDGVILDADPLTGIVERFHFDPETGTATITSEQTVTDLVETAKARYNSVDERARFGDFAHVAHIPAVIMADLMKRGIPQDEKAMSRWLNDPDNRVFRTRPGRV